MTATPRVVLATEAGLESEAVPVRVKAALVRAGTESVWAMAGGLRSRPKLTRLETALAGVVRLPAASRALTQRDLWPSPERVTEAVQLVVPEARVQPLPPTVGSSAEWSVEVEAT